MIATHHRELEVEPTDPVATSFYLKSTRRASPPARTDVRQINGLADNANKRICRTLVLPVLPGRCGISPVTWQGPDGDGHVLSPARAGIGLASIALRRRAGTVRRNLTAEEQVMKAGLAPGQERDLGNSFGATPGSADRFVCGGPGCSDCQSRLCFDGAYSQGLPLCWRGRGQFWLVARSFPCQPGLKEIDLPGLRVAPG